MQKTRSEPLGTVVMQLETGQVVERTHGVTIEYDPSITANADNRRSGRVVAFWIKLENGCVIESAGFRDGCECMMRGCLWCAKFEVSKEISNQTLNWCLSKSGKTQRRYTFRFEFDNSPILAKLSIPRNWPSDVNATFCLSLGADKFAMAQYQITFGELNDVVVGRFACDNEFLMQAFGTYLRENLSKAADPSLLDAHAVKMPSNYFSDYWLQQLVSRLSKRVALLKKSE
jgi:hypothetical protein